MTVGDRTAAIGEACRLRGQPRSEHEGWFDVECFGSRDAEDLRVEVTEEPVAAHLARKESERAPYEPWRLARSQTGEVLTARQDCSCGDAWVMGEDDRGEVPCVANPGFRCGPARWERVPTNPSRK